MPCNLCGQANFQKQMTIQGHDVVRCAHCSLQCLDPIPTDDDIAKMYSREYYQSRNSNQVGYSNYKKDVDLIILTIIRRYKMLREKIFQKENLRMLDVGCAYGYYLDIARLYGWDVTGVEINPAAAEECVGVTRLNVKKGSLHDARFPSNYFDLISSWDLIEHVQDPQLFFKEISRILKPGGSYVLSTPDIDSWPSRIMGKRWMGYKSKEHIYFFSKRTLQHYCGKNGLQVKESRYVGKYVSRDLFIDRLKYYFGPIASWARFFSPAYFYINPFDIVYLRAEKLRA